MEEMINRKNELLLGASKKLIDVGEIARMLEGVDFDSAISARIFCKVVGEYLRNTSYGAYAMREEADKALPEAVEVPENETDM